MQTSSTKCALPAKVHLVRANSPGFAGLDAKVQSEIERNKKIEQIGLICLHFCI
jgi:hypothetical protein